MPTPSTRSIVTLRFARAVQAIMRGTITGRNELTRTYQLGGKLVQHYKAINDTTITHRQAQSKHDCTQISFDALEMQLRALHIR